jgi:hypothetical protein
MIRPEKYQKSVSLRSGKGFKGGTSNANSSQNARKVCHLTIVLSTRIERPELVPNMAGGGEGVLY